MRWIVLFVVVLLTPLAGAGGKVAPAPSEHTQQPTDLCSREGHSVVRVRMLDANDQVLSVKANAVIVALRCGGVMRADGIVELRAVPSGRHLIQVRALGFPGDSVQVTSGAADTVLVTVHMKGGHRVRHHPATIVEREPGW